VINPSRQCIYAPISQTGESWIINSIHGPNGFAQRLREQSHGFGEDFFLPFTWKKILGHNEEKFGRVHPSYVPMPVIREKMLHLDAKQVVNYNRYFKFSFVRNPWERAFAQYQRLKKYNETYNEIYRTQSKITPTFQHFTLGFDDPESVYYEKTRWTQAYHSLGSQYLGRFESIQKDYEKMSEFHDIFSKPRRIIRSLFRFRDLNSIGEQWKNAYTSESRKAVQEKYAEDIDLFKYTF
jgi:hypothetical protein